MGPRTLARNLSRPSRQNSPKAAPPAQPIKFTGGLPACWAASGERENRFLRRMGAIFGWFGSKRSCCAKTITSNRLLETARRAGRGAWHLGGARPVAIPDHSPNSGADGSFRSVATRHPVDSRAGNQRNFTSQFRGVSVCLAIHRSAAAGRCAARASLLVAAVVHDSLQVG